MRVRDLRKGDRVGFNGLAVVLTSDLMPRDGVPGEFEHQCGVDFGVGKLVQVHPLTWDDPDEELPEWYAVARDESLFR